MIRDAASRMRPRSSSARSGGATAALIAAALLLAGCSAPATSDTGSAAAEHTTDAAHAEPVALTGGWAKAGEGMTGVFGTLENHGDADIALTAVDSPAAAMVELHETVTSGSSATMRPVEGGFTIPAGGTFLLEPGGDHIMFMDMAAPLLPGDEVPLTLHFDDGSELELTVLVKDFAGAQENYEGSDEHEHEHGSDHGDHSEHDAEHDADHAEH